MEGKIKTQELTPLEIINRAVSGDADVEKIRQLMDLQREWELGNAKRAFSESVSKVQSQIPVIKERGKNPQTHSKYALTEDIVSAITPIYTSEGISVSFYEGDTPREHHVRVCMDVRKGIFVETRFYDSPIDDKGIAGKTNKTPIHARASAFTYGKRYLMCLYFNIPTGDDDDGNAAGNVKTIGDKELSYIRDALNATGDKEAALCKHLKIDDLEDLPVSLYPKVKGTVDARVKEKGAQ